MNKDIEKLIKIQGMINNQFHLHIDTDLKEKCDWVLFIKFPNKEDYFSNYNRPILDSKRSSVSELEDYLTKYDGFSRW